MRALFVVLLAVAVLLTAAFLVALGRPRSHEDRGVALFLAATGWSGLAVDTVLLVAVLGQVVSPWVAAAAIILQDVVFGWRLWLAVRYRHHP